MQPNEDISIKFETYLGETYDSGEGKHIAIPRTSMTETELEIKPLTLHNNGKYTHQPCSKPIFHIAALLYLELASLV